MPRFFTIFEKNLFKTSAASDFDLTIYFFSAKFIQSLETDLSEIKGFIASQNCLLLLIFLHLGFRNISF